MKVKFNNKTKQFSTIGEQSVTSKGKLLIIDCNNKESDYKGSYVGRVSKDIKVLNNKGKLFSDSIQTTNDLISHGKTCVDILKSNYVELHGSITSRLVECNITDIKFTSDSEIDYIKCNTIKIEELESPLLLRLINHPTRSKRLIIHKLECDSAELSGNIVIGKLICRGRLTKDNKVTILK